MNNNEGTKMEMDVKIEKKARVYTIRQLVKAINKVLKLIPDDHNDIGNRYSIHLLEITPSRHLKMGVFKDKS